MGGGGGLGFHFADNEEDTSYHRIKTLVNEELKKYFRPEFLNRLDDIIVFRQLNKEEVREIAELLLSELNDRLRSKGFSLEVTQAFLHRIIEDGYNPKFGA